MTRDEVTRERKVQDKAGEMSRAGSVDLILHTEETFPHLPVMGQSPCGMLVSVISKAHGRASGANLGGGRPES